MLRKMVVSAHTACVIIPFFSLARQYCEATIDKEIVLYSLYIKYALNLTLIIHFVEIWLLKPIKFITSKPYACIKHFTDDNK